MATANLLTIGIYTVRDAVQLLHINAQKARGWLTGYPRTKSPPILENDIGWLDNSLAFSFTNLMEVRFVQHFAGHGVRADTIRQIAEEARRLLDHPHPFATSTVFKTDGKKIFASVAEATRDQKLYDLRAKNWAMVEVIAQSLKKGAIYDPAGDIRGWYPRQNVCPNVVILPNVAFGKPALKKYGIPTETLARSFMAEGETHESVAAWYEILPDHVREAVRFQSEIALAV